MVRRTSPTKTRAQRLIHEEIVRAAADCFGEKGYRATTLDEVAGHAGVSKATLYNYVASKEELLCLVFEWTIHSFREALGHILAEGLSAEEALRRVVRSQVTLVANHVSFLKVFFDEEAGLPAAIAKRITREKRAYDLSVEEVVRQGIESGALRPVSSRLFVLALFGMCNWLSKWYRSDGALTPEEIAAGFIDILERGVLQRVDEGIDASVEIRSLRRMEAKLDGLMLAFQAAVPPRSDLRATRQRRGTDAKRAQLS